MATRKISTSTRAHRQGEHAVHVAADHAVSSAAPAREGLLRDRIEHLISCLRSLDDPRIALASAGNHRSPVGEHARQSLGKPFVNEPSGTEEETPPAMVTARTPLNHNNLPLFERAPEISTQLIVLEHLFQAARERGSGAVPMYGDADWDAFWFGLERIVRHVRLLADDMYAQGRIEGC
jgi:hypothetical protein